MSEDSDDLERIVKAANGLACENDLRHRVEECVERAECSCPLASLVAAVCGDTVPPPRIVRY